MQSTKDNIPEGFQKTEVGVIPEDWEVDTLEGIAEVIDPHPSHRAPKVDPTGIPFVGIGDLNEQGKIVSQKTRLVPYETLFEHNKRYNLNDNLLGLGRVASIGKVVKLKKYTEPYTISPTLGIIKAKSVPSNYLSQVLNSKFVKRQFKNIMSGSTRSSVGMIVLRKLKIPLPPTLAEQTAIANALSDMDALIDAQEKLIHKKRLIKQGAMQELLRPKEGWVTKTLGEIGDFKNGINKSSTDFGFGYPFVNLMDVFGKTSISTAASLDLINSNTAERKLYNLKEGDVLFIRSSVKPSGVGLTCVIQKKLNNTVFSGFIIRFRDKGFFNTLYKKYCFHYEPFRNQLISNATISANTNINQDALKRLIITFPKTHEEQQQIAQILSDMDIEIEQLETQLSKHKQMKAGMMQELLTGKKRLNLDLKD